MSILKHAKVEGLWDDKTIEVDFDQRVNFLIGINGSGKTTLLNLIASALSSDFEGLDRIPFGTLQCTLYSPKGDSSFDVFVIRAADELRRTSFHYIIKEPGKIDQAFQLLSASPRYLMASTRLRKQSEAPALVYSEDDSPLRSLVRVKWLSVHRTPSKTRSDERPASDSSVDRRLTSLSNELVRYFSKLAALRELETTRFLRQMLSTMIYNVSDFNPLAAAKELDLPALQHSIETLLDTFLPANAAKVREKLRAHFEIAAKAREDKSTFELEELIALATIIPMQKIVGDWNLTQSKQENIAKPRTEFLQTMNAMYSNKELSLNQRNEVQVDLPNGKHLTLSELSSGEKQLLIIFSEALLQEKAEFIYIADEPELSLHVTWQEQLTRNLLRINPNAQVIFATHSPDIVSQYGDRTIDMEALLS